MAHDPRNIKLIVTVSPTRRNISRIFTASRAGECGEPRSKGAVEIAAAFERFAKSSENPIAWPDPWGFAAVPSPGIISSQKILPDLDLEFQLVSELLPDALADPVD